MTAAASTAPVCVALPDALEQHAPVLMSQGAEALVLALDTGAVAKFRPAKPWRLAELDAQLRKRRTTQEARVLQKLADAGVDVPRLDSVDTRSGTIFMEHVEGPSLKQATWDAVNAAAAGGAAAVDAVAPLYRALGAAVAHVHSRNIVHGDLTTSNAIARPSGSVCLIDFGLSSQAASVEDKAVDLYVLERAIQSTHPEEAAALMQGSVMPSYEARARELEDKKLGDVLQRLQKVRGRGRKRTQLG